MPLIQPIVNPHFNNMPLNQPIVNPPSAVGGSYSNNIPLNQPIVNPPSAVGGSYSNNIPLNQPIVNPPSAVGGSYYNNIPLNQPIVNPPSAVGGSYYNNIPLNQPIVNPRILYPSRQGHAWSGESRNRGHAPNNLSRPPYNRDRNNHNYYGHRGSDHTPTATRSHYNKDGNKYRYDHGHNRGRQSDHMQISRRGPDSLTSASSRQPEGDPSVRGEKRRTDVDGLNINNSIQNRKDDNDLHSNAENVSKPSDDSNEGPTSDNDYSWEDTYEKDDDEPPPSKKQEIDLSKPKSDQLPEAVTYNPW
ncbi:hypothetical protein F5050DRAFT_207238 [Lentinula boryana]|uniref:Uncharacterized protein n=1 Tax=Lentinula boryana TaxID=40481 RepID=A0ABQ8QBX1_9AGAR|nr:hypothetical protein F5050DRAFT_207238 [Lentinula boryana]